MALSLQDTASNPVASVWTQPPSVQVSVVHPSPSSQSAGSQPGCGTVVVVVLDDCPAMAGWMKGRKPFVNGPSSSTKPPNPSPRNMPTIREYLRCLVTTASIL